MQHQTKNNHVKTSFFLLLVFFVIYHWKTLQQIDIQNLYSASNDKRFGGGKFKSEKLFVENWKEIAYSKINYEDILGTCDMKWKVEEAYPWFRKTARTAHNTTYICSLQIKPTGEFSSVTIQTRYSNGTMKSNGGDYWRVFVRGNSSLPVSKKDLGNGAYVFKFFPMFAGEYWIKIYLEYTLCDGVKQPPPDWFIKGNIQGKHQLHGILAKDMPFINKPLQNSVDAQFVVPAQGNQIEADSMLANVCRNKDNACRYLWHGYGSWINTTTWQPLCKNVNFRYPRKNKGMLWIFGDSLAHRFFHQIKLSRLCRSIFSSCMYTYNWVYSLENYNVSLKSFVKSNPEKKRLWNNLDFNISQIIIELKQALLHPSMDNNSVILFNYGLHYTESTNFTNYQHLIQEVVKLKKYVRCKMIWRTTTSLNKHKRVKQNLHSVRFMTSQRVQLYNAYATNEFCKAGFDVLDVYPLTDSYPEGTGSKATPYDPVHYQENVMKPIENLLERVFEE